MVKVIEIEKTRIVVDDEVPIENPELILDFLEEIMVNHLINQKDSKNRPNQN